MSDRNKLVDAPEPSGPSRGGLHFRAVPPGQLGDAGADPRRALHALSLPLRDASGAFYIVRLLEELNLRPADLARALDVKATQVYAWDRPEPVEPRDEGVRDKLAALVKVVDILRRLIADHGPSGPSAREQRQLWLHNPQPVFRFERPIDLLLSGRSDQVFDELWAIYSGHVSI